MAALYCPGCRAPIEHAEDPACGSCGEPRPPRGYPADALLGDWVAGGEFKVIARLGAGGFGVVYEVETRFGGERRALKVLGPEWTGDEVVRQKFENEALMLEQVRHPNVARCFGVGYLRERQRSYLLFELIEGQRLDRIVAAGGEIHPLDPKRAVRLATQIASALQTAHHNGVLHRDLKPDNIIVVDAGTEHEQVKIIDFGIAKLTEEGATSTQSIVGTPEYMAPEQFLPGSSLDFRTDIWQLGATLFFALVGRSPYPPRRTGGIAAIVSEQLRRQDAGPAPSEVVPAFARHAALDTLVSEMLATDPDARPSTAQEVLRRLEAAVTGV